MPNIQIRDCVGQCYTIHSSDPDTISRWLVEHLRNMVSASTTYNHPVYLDVWPMFVQADDGKPAVMDWTPANGRSYAQFQLDYEHMSWIIGLLEKEAYQSRETMEMSGVKWCDIGGHAFPAGDPGASTITLNVPVSNQWGGEQIQQVVKDCCSDCSKQLSDGFGDLLDREKKNYMPGRASKHRTRRLEGVIESEGLT